ncbi:MAG: hypothetical protein AAF281_08560, partial [Pseudomonadota bacterium]
PPEGSVARVDLVIIVSDDDGASVEAPFSIQILDDPEEAATAERAAETAAWLAELGAPDGADAPLLPLDLNRQLASETRAAEVRATTGFLRSL